MTPSIACCINFFDDVKALTGCLETAARYFDNIFTINTGPHGARSTDGSVELLESVGATVLFDDVQRGFGHIRSRLIHECGCEWAFIMDCDERFIPQLPVMHCEGTESYPQHPQPNLTVTHKPEVCDQGALLKRLITRPEAMAIRTTRRHWFDFAMRNPSQNWLRNRDHQLRVVRNVPEIGYDPKVVMHEQLQDTRTGQTPHYVEQDDYGGPFHDHFHLFYRRTEPGKKEERERNYDRLSRGQPMNPL